MNYQCLTSSNNNMVDARKLSVRCKTSDSSFYFTYSI